MLAHKWLLPLEESHNLFNDKIARLELAKTPINKRRSELLDSLRPVLRRGRDLPLRFAPGYKLRILFTSKPKK